MKKGIIGKKIGMTQIFDEKGNVIPVTVIETAGNIVSQIKTVETDGYNAIQLGYGEIKDKHINKPEAGHFAKAKIAETTFIDLLSSTIDLISKSVFISGTAHCKVLYPATLKCACGPTISFPTKDFK